MFDKIPSLKFIIAESMEFFSSKPKVPQFVMKIYYILERNEFEDVMSWTLSGSEIHIKNAKLLQEKVLPLYFRHKKIESFVRQLNMYRFNKVNKSCKDKTHMFFRNDLFRKGQPQSLCQIKRKKKGKLDDSGDEIKEEDQTQTLDSYKEFIKGNILQIQSQLRKLKKTHPYLVADLSKIYQFCDVLVGQGSHPTNFSNNNIVSNGNFFKTFKDLVSSLNNFDSHCSIQMDLKS